MIVNFPAQGIGQKLGGKCADELLAATQQDFAQAGDAIELSAIWQRSRRVYRGSLASGAPFPDCIEILEREPQRVHANVAASAGWVFAVFFHSLPNRRGLTICAAVLQRGD